MNNIDMNIIDTQDSVDDIMKNIKKGIDTINDTMDFVTFTKWKFYLLGQMTILEYRLKEKREYHSNNSLLS